jgi:amino acid adenylation domain-containing protein
MGRGAELCPDYFAGRVAVRFDVYAFPRIMKPSDQRPADISDAQFPAERARILLAELLRKSGDLRTAPLSLPQQRLWVLDQLESRAAAYNLSLGLRLNGELDLTALERSLQEIVNRHDVLHTEFRLYDGWPVQFVVAPPRVDLRLTDLSPTPVGDKELQVYRLAVEEGRALFDLTRSPLFRLQLLRLNPEEHVLICTMHHIISDGWSLGVFFRELTALYEAFSSGRASPLPDLPIQYGDYAEWERNWLSGEALANQIAYWRKRMEGAAFFLDLPSDHSRPPQQTYDGTSQTVPVPKDLFQELDSLARSRQATLFMVMLAAFNVLLCRYSGAEDVLVGAPVAGRSQLETEALIGFFVNTVVLRTDMSGNPKFCDLLAQVREATLGALENADVPFERLVEEFQPPRNLSYNPIFQVLFSAIKAPVQSQGFGSLTVSPYIVNSGTSRFDLAVNLILGAHDQSWIQVEYNTTIFDSPRITRLLQHYLTLLRAIADRPQLSISDLPLVGQDELQQLLVTVNETAAEFPRERCIHQLFEDQAARTPDAVAVICGEIRLSYAELNARANQLASYLQKRDVGPEVAVGLLVERSVNMLVGILGILKAGAAYVPMDPAYPAGRLVHILREAHTPFLLTQENLVRSLPALHVDVIRFDADARAIAKEPTKNPSTTLRPENLAYVLFTSGSIGGPKGVALEHRSASNLVHWAQTVFTAEELWGTLCSTSMCFDLSVFEMFVPLSVGAKVIIAPNVLSLPSLPAREEVTLVNTVPSAMNELMRQGAVPGCIRVINLAGEALGSELVDELYGKTNAQKIYNLYGPTECTTYSTFALMSPGEAVTIGRPIANTQAYILDSHRQVVPIGVTGELYLGGDGLARGYYGQPSLTAELFVRNPFGEQTESRMYRTGDLCRFLPDGRILYIGRIDDQVKIRGFRIQLAEIESALAQNQDVHRCVVVAREDGPGGKRLIAYVVPTPGQRITIDDLRRSLVENLPDYLVPSAFVLLDSLPLTPNGKIDRRALPAPEELAQRRVEPRTVLETQLLMIWEEVLGRNGIGVQDNFFDLGGHSLLAVRVFAQIERVFKKRLPLALLFHAPTIERLASSLAQDGFQAPWGSLVTIQSSGPNPPLFVVPGVDGNVVGFSELARLLGPEQPFYGLQSRGLDGREKPFEHIEDVATHFLAEVQQVDPKGPYYLAGACTGGVVAYEMAQQLIDQGKQVAFLGLLETWPPQESPFIGGARSRFSAHISFLARGVRRHFRNLAKIPPLQWAPYLLDKGKIVVQMISMRDIYRGDRHTMYRDQVSQANGRALSRYDPKRFRGRLSLILASAREVAGSEDPRLKWGEWAEDGHTVSWIFARDSGLLLVRPHVEILAEHLKACLDQVRKDAENTNSQK